MIKSGDDVAGHYSCFMIIKQKKIMVNRARDTKVALNIVPFFVPRNM